MDWPLQLYKSSLSGLLSRQGLSAAMKSERVRDFIIFAQKLECPDEALWSTIFGNPNMLPIPSTFDAKAVLAQLQIEEKAIKRRCTMSAAKNRTIEEPFVLDDYYISRYQVWMWPYSENTNPFCHGKFAHYSCVYGLLDLKNLITRPELVAHKFYLDVEPAAYFVLYEAIRHRALNTTTQAAFRGRVYAQLPFVQMAAGVNISTLQLHINQCRINW